MRLTKNFTLTEFTNNQWATKLEQVRSDASLTDAILHNIALLANELQVLRDYLGASVTINIAFRPKWWELMKGRSGGSKHCLGMAADIVVKGYTPEQVYQTIRLLIKKGKMKQGGLGMYDTFTHYDIRGTKARW